MKPAKISIKTVLPAPDGPIIAVSSPARKFPLTFDSSVFFSANQQRQN